MDREKYLMKTFPLKDGTTYIQNIDKHMSEKKIDKGKVAKKLHQLQKKLNRVEENESWVSRKIKQVREHKLIQKLRGKTKIKNHVDSKEI